MSTFGDDLIQSLNEALAHAKGDGPAILHAPVTPREVREQANLTQAQMAPLMGMSLFRLPEMGARDAPGQWAGRNPSAYDRKGTRGRQARIVIFGLMVCPARGRPGPGYPAARAC